MLISCFVSLSPQGFKQQALAVSTDPEHRFELALQLGELKIAYQLAVEAEVRCCLCSLPLNFPFIHYRFHLYTKNEHKHFTPLFSMLSFSPLQSEQKWKQLAELAISKCQFGLAQECLHHAQDYGGLLLLATASGNATMVGKLAEGAERDGKNNVAFMTYFLQGK